jgi:hypothetical protein
MKGSHFPLNCGSAEVTALVFWTVQQPLQISVASRVGTRRGPLLSLSRPDGTSVAEVTALVFWNGDHGPQHCHVP